MCSIKSAALFEFQFELFANGLRASTALQLHEHAPYLKLNLQHPSDFNEYINGRRILPSLVPTDHLPTDIEFVRQIGLRQTG